MLKNTCAVLCVLLTIPMATAQNTKSLAERNRTDADVARKHHSGASAECSKLLAYKVDKVAKVVTQPRAQCQARVDGYLREVAKAAAAKK